MVGRNLPSPQQQTCWEEAPPQFLVLRFSPKAKVFQQCFAENLLRVLTKRQNVKFTQTEQGEKETDEQFSSRRKKDAAQAAEKIFAMVAPKNAADETELVLKQCAFAYKKAKGPLGVQVNMHECKFEDAIAQIGDKLSEFKTIKLYTACFNEEMQKELKFAAAADAKAGTDAFAVSRADLGISALQKNPKF